MAHAEPLLFKEDHIEANTLTPGTINHVVKKMHIMHKTIQIQGEFTIFSGGKI